MKARTQSRKSIVTSGHCRKVNGVQWEVALADVSERGCRMRDRSGPLREGESLSLFLHGTGPHYARVAWRRGMDVGLAFDRPLEDAFLAALADASHSSATAGDIWR